MSILLRKSEERASSPQKRPRTQSDESSTVTLQDADNVIESLQNTMNLLWQRVKKLRAQVDRYQKAMTAIRNNLDYGLCEECE